MAKFLLLLHDKPSAAPDYSPEEMQKIIQEYVNWARGLEAKNVLLSSHKLHDEGGKHITGDANGAAVVTDGPYSEAKEIIGGFFLIEAGSYDEAVDLCRDIPHIRYGGKVEIRAVHELD